MKSSVEFSNSYCHAKNLSREDSITIKGILIILIVLGHMKPLIPWPSPMFSWLYSFHVACFFILPFFYESPPVINIRQQILKMVVRTGIPFFFTFLLCILSHLIIEKRAEEICNISFALMTGSVEYLDRYANAGFLWFLQSYFSMSVFIVLADKYKYLRYAILLIGLYLWCINIGLMHYYERHCILGIPVALKYYFAGYICRNLFCKFNILQWISIVLFTLFTVLKLSDYTAIIPTKISFFALMGAFVILLKISPFVKNPIFTLFGKHSLTVYLLHLFVYTLLLMLSPIQGFWGGLILFIATLSISLMLSLLIGHIQWLRKLYTPRNLKEFINFYKN